MLPSRPFAEKQERPVGQKLRAFGYINPRVRRFAEKTSRFSASLRGRIEIKPRLGPVLNKEENLFTVRHPPGLIYQICPFKVIIQLNPSDISSCRCYDSDVPLRIRFGRSRIRRLLP